MVWQTGGQHGWRSSWPAAAAAAEGNLEQLKCCSVLFRLCQEIKTFLLCFTYLTVCVLSIEYCCGSATFRYTGLQQYISLCVYTLDADFMPEISAMHENGSCRC